MRGFHDRVDGGGGVYFFFLFFFSKVGSKVPIKGKKNEIYTNMLGWKTRKNNGDAAVKRVCINGENTQLKEEGLQVYV